jgi:hypothetical protein
MNLDGIWAKLDRVTEHLQELNEVVAEYMGREPLEVKGALLQGRYSATVTIKEPPPIKASIVVGDLIHSARSAPDHLLWELVIAGGGAPGT